MSDLVARLRACDCSVHCKSGCIQEKAADEIEQLRAKLEYAVTGYKEAANEIERLRKAGYGGLHYDLAEAQRQEIERLEAALEIIAGRRQCLDNLMSNAEVARAALTHGPRDDGTVVAVGGEPGASAGKSE